MKITVLMATYNSSRYIRSAICSILNQSFKNFEFVIIDDGSTDNMCEIISSFEDDRIKLFRREHHGLAESLNYGVEHATTEWIARMDSDDISHPLRLEKQIAIVDNSDNNTIISNWYAVFNSDRISYLVRSETSSDKIKKRLLLHSEVLHPSMMVHRNILLSNKFSGTSFEDYKLWLEIRNEVEFKIIPEVLFFYRFRPDSLSHKMEYTKYNPCYKISEPFYNESLVKTFLLNSEIEENKFRGWREFFHGDKNDARKYWKCIPLTKINWKLGAAFLLTWLPEKILMTIKRTRIRFRLDYILKYYFRESVKARKTFKRLINL